MFIKINDININYEFHNNKKKMTIVFLHGWGQNIEMMKPLGESFKNDYNLLYIDLPGFGQSEEPNKVYTVYDYVYLLKKMYESLKLEDITLVGHSFGGKISLLYSSLYEVNKLVVMGSPFDVEKNKLSFKIKVLKLLKKVPIINLFENYAKTKIGSSDYKGASVIMRKVLTDTVNLSIKEELSNIKCETLIIWGSQDDAVDIKYAYELETIIPKAGLVVYENATHYAYLERLDQTKKVLKSFFESGV
jgi:pimeloyl-ACP methyl ester carboxylesterase